MIPRGEFVKVLTSLSILILVAACSTVERQPAATDPTWPPLQNLQRSLQAVTGPNYNNQTCSSILTEIQQHFKDLRWEQYSNSELTTIAKRALQVSWTLRLAIHQQLATNGKECALLARDVFHRGRDFEDFLGEFAYSQTPLSPEQLDFQSQPIPIYDRAAYPPYFVRQDVDEARFQLRTGDLMLARGTSYLSAIVTQISDNRSHFSHMVLTSPNSETGALGTVESYIGIGVKAYDIEFALKNDNARLLVLRPKNAALGAKAAQFAQQAAHANIPYDYASDFKDYSKMSCVEVGVFAYDKASEGKVHIPAQPAHLNVHNQNFLSQMNIPSGEMITPDDLETDPNFEMVLDWKDYRLIRDSRQKDALLAEMIRWISELQYSFHDSFKSFGAKNLAFPVRRTPFWPSFQKLTKSPNFDLEIPRKTLGMLSVLGTVGDTLLNELRTKDVAYFAKYQRPMTNQQLREALEEFRQQDLAMYQQHGKSAIHSLFRPEQLPKAGTKIKAL